MKALLTVVGLAVLAPAAAAEKPNIVFLLADDLGFGDLGCTGHPYIKTPSIDRLAKEGTLIHSYYEAGPTCCPSRTGLMTGQFPASFAKYPSTYGFSGAVTVTDLLKKNGYQTGHFGKWHIGNQDKPGTFGIDSIKVLKGNHDDSRGRDAGIADAAVDFIRANRAGPFYVNVWFHTPHYQVNPHKSFVDRFKDLAVSKADFANPDTLAHFAKYASMGGNLDSAMRNFCGDVSQLDDQCAKVLKVIDELGLRQNTIVVFTSDNGPARCQDGEGQAAKEKGKLKVNMVGTAGPLRERKFSLHDGGIRLPFIVRWPGHVKEGRVDTTSVTAGVDWLPTLCSITGAAFDASKLVGEDVSAVWLGAERPRTKDLFWKVSRPKSPVAMRRGQWKLYMAPPGEPAELYDVANDPGERKNLAAANPTVVADLSAVAKKWNASLPAKYEKGAADDQ
jgi:arylsulfatase A-like enzyme